MRFDGRYLALACCVMALAGCGSKRDATDANLGAAISRFLETHGDLCLGMRFGGWPVDIAASMQAGTLAQEMGAFESAGLVSGEGAVVDETNLFGRPTGFQTRVRRYRLTDKDARAYRDQPDVDLAGRAAGDRVGDFCFGKQRLASVVSVVGPLTKGDGEEAVVTYAYKIDDLADWAHTPAVRAAFPDVDRVIDGAGKVNPRLPLELSSAGWRVAGGK